MDGMSIYVIRVAELGELLNRGAPNFGFVRRSLAKIWLKELQRALGHSAVLMIIGNKLDLAHSRTVALEEAKEYASLMGAMYEETSAKENIGIDQAFERLCKGTEGEII
ncbi:Ras family protein [Dictyocaulus viviparus]|uniref:Ras family protein n=1 Tax=Dictyocaulus viviparus TaxID=29172 RepID=A0A0D8Y6W1_DICVI|nr:Ras family protein [Dictyocaulus viviparus]